MSHLPFLIDRPYLLLLAPVIVFVFWAIARRSRAGLDPKSQRAALVARSLIALLLVLAISGFQWVERTNKLTTIFLVDVSQSIRPDQRAQNMEFVRKAIAAKHGGDQAGVVVFGRTPLLAEPPAETVPVMGEAHVDNDATDLSGAIKIAHSAFPSDTGKKIVFLTDGNENIGSAESDLENLRGDRIRVDVATSSATNSADMLNTPEAMVDNVVLPVRVRQSDPFPVRTIVSSTVPQSATLTVERDGHAVSSQKIHLNSGKNSVVISEKIDEPGTHRYDATIQPDADSFTENNHAYGIVSVVGKPRVLYVAGSNLPAYQFLKREMAAQHIDLVTATPDAVPTDVAALQAYESIVLSNVPASELTQPQMSAIETSVKDFGVGLGMVGGEDSFGAGRYYGTPIEAALPVRMDVREKRRLPPAAVVIVLDASGSMSATENGVEKVQLAARAALQLMDALQPDDEIAVTTVTTVTTQVVPLQPASRAKGMKDAIAGVSAGGEGIFCFQGLEDAYMLLQRSKAPIKHVIICPDTNDSKQQEGCVDLAKQMRAKYHITTTVVGIGQATDQHVPFQKQLAAAGGGQLFIVNEATNLPSYFYRDVQQIHQPLFVEKPFFPRLHPGNPVLDGVPFASEPPLLGYNVTTLKPGAGIGLSVPGADDPVFATWRYGLGRTFAFTSDERAHWGAQWLGWPAYGQFWAQTLRWSLRGDSTADFQAAADLESGKGHIVVDAFTSGGSYANGAQWKVRLAAPGVPAADVELNQTGPGRYEGAFPADQLGTYLVNIRRLAQGGQGTQRSGAESSKTIELVVPYSPEYRTIGPNLPLLTRLADSTGGKMQSDPERIFRDRPSWVYGTLPLAPWLVWLAAMLFLGDIGIRRLGLRRRKPASAPKAGLAESGRRAYRALRLQSLSPQPLTPVEQTRLLERKPGIDAGHAGAPPGNSGGQLLNRRAVPDRDDDDPFPHVVKLPLRARTGRSRDKSEDGDSG